MSKNTDALIQAFRNPHDDYGPIVMWFWNDEITEDGITFQLEKFKEQNITNFFIHPACGFCVEYLSERYMELIQYVVREAKRLGMYYWIYDEYEYPSGTAGGILCRDYPQYRQKELHVEEFQVYPGDRITFARPGQLIAAQLIAEKNGENDVRDVSDFCTQTTHGDYTEVSFWYQDTNLPGRVLFFFSEYNLSLLPSGMLRVGSNTIPGYVDMMSYEAVGKFIELTHERYKQYIGDEFGKTVRGVFTDEPTTLRHFDYTTASLWSDTFDEEFQKDHGYSLIPWLYLLWTTEAKRPEEIRVHRHYWQTVKRLYFTNFMGQISSWCRNNHLLFTGHFGGEEGLLGHIAQGDMLQELTMFDLPGMDAIVSSQKINYKEFNIAAKLPSSAAKFNGSDRVLCETFSGSGWYMRFPEMKRIVNRLMLLGVNWIQYMGAFYSIGGAAKNFPYGYAPSHGYQNPFFPFYHKLGEHIAAFSALSANTKPDSSVLMFLPLQHTQQERYLANLRKFDDDDDFNTVRNRCVVDTANAMIAEGIGFDLFSENMTDAITVHDGFVEAYGYRYDALIFPHMRFVDPPVRALLEQLKAHQVKTIFLYHLPSVDTGSGEAFDAGYRMQPFDSALSIRRDGSAYLIEPKEFPVLMSLHRSAMQAVISSRHLNVQADEGVFLTKRSNDAAEVWFLCNDNRTSADASFDALPGMRILNPATGENAAYTVCDGRVSLTLQGFEMLAILRDKVGGALPETTLQPALPEKTMVLPDPYCFTAEDGNYLPLNYEMFDEETGLWDPCRFLYFSDHIHIPVSGHYRIRSRIQIDHLPSSVLLNAEVQRVTRLTVNGTELPFCANVRRWSPADYTTEIAQLLCCGENIIEVEGITEPIPRINRPPYLYLSGDFSVDAQDHLTAPVHLLPAGNWEKLSYPYFCGIGIYKVNAVVDGDFRKAVLKLNTDDIAQVFINGKNAGTKLWASDLLDVTGLLQSGENRIEVRITASRANMFAAEWYPHAPHLSMTHTENGILKPMELRFYR